MNTLIIFFIFVPILAFILLALNLFLATHKPYESKVSAYECGFSPIYGQTRSTFQIHFYIVAMLFLIFDLEILLIFPAAVTLYQISTFGFVMLIVFFLVLTIGFILEIGTGAISLSSIESSNKNFNSKLTPYSSLQTINNKSFYNKIKFQFQHRASLSTLAINNNNEKIDFWKEVYETDKDQDTNNPHLIARRHLNKGGITDAKIINLVQSQLGNTINQKELDFLTSIKPITIFLWVFN